MAYVFVHALLRPEIAPRERGPQNLAEFAAALADLLPFAIVIGGTMGSLYFGWATPTEAAAVGCLAAFVVSAIWGRLGWTELKTAMTSSVMISGNILLIVYVAFVFSYAISVAGVGEIADQLAGRAEPVEARILLRPVRSSTRILGCLVESLGMIVITVPLLYPVLLKYGIDPVWFGIILVLFIELGQISPPIGINLFVIQSIWDGKLSDIVWGTIPFHLLMFVLLVMLVFWPEIALWLPASHEYTAMSDRPPRCLSDRAAGTPRPAIARCASAWRRPASSWRPAPTTASPPAWSRSRASMRSTSRAPASR